MRLAISLLDDMKFLTSQNEIEAVHNLLKVSSHVQSVWLERKLNTAVQTSITVHLPINDFEHCI